MEKHFPNERLQAKHGQTIQQNEFPDAVVALGQAQGASSLWHSLISSSHHPEGHSNISLRVPLHGHCSDPQSPWQVSAPPPPHSIDLKPRP